VFAYAGARGSSVSRTRYGVADFPWGGPSPSVALATNRTRPAPPIWAGGAAERKRKQEADPSAGGLSATINVDTAPGFCHSRPVTPCHHVGTAAGNQDFENSVEQPDVVSDYRRNSRRMPHFRGFAARAHEKRKKRKTACLGAPAPKTDRHDPAAPDTSSRAHRDTVAQ